MVPVLAESKLQTGVVGRYSFAALLFQDLAVAPLLFLVPMLSGASGGAVATLAAVAALVDGATRGALSTGVFDIGPLL